MENTASRVHSHLQLNHTESTLEVILSIRLSHLCKHEQIAKHQHTQSRRYLPSFTSGFHAFFHFWNITFVLCAGLCASTKYCQSIQLCCVSIMMLGLTKKISVMEDQSYSLQLQSLSNWNDEETFRNMRYCEGGGHVFFSFFHHIRYLVRVFRLCNYPEMNTDNFFNKMVVRFFSDSAWKGCFTI